MSILDSNNLNNKSLHNKNLHVKILDYEEKIFNEFIQKRTNLLKNIKNMDLSKLNNNELNNFIFNLKDIIDPIKNVNETIDNLQSNIELNNFNFQNNDNNKSNFILFYLLFGDFFFLTSSLSELSTDSLSDESEISSLSSDSLCSESESESEE